MGLAIDFFGADRVLWASDHPFWDPNTTHEALAALKLAPGVKQAIEIGNATRLLGLETPAD
jgi:aminocarboxymuconate-semialdehyde decarboxylase